MTPHLKVTWRNGVCTVRTHMGLYARAEGDYSKRLEKAFVDELMKIQQEEILKNGQSQNGNADAAQRDEESRSGGAELGEQHTEGSSGEAD